MLEVDQMLATTFWGYLQIFPSLFLPKKAQLLIMNSMIWGWFYFFEMHRVLMLIHLYSIPTHLAGQKNVLPNENIITLIISE